MPVGKCAAVLRRYFSCADALRYQPSPLPFRPHPAGRVRRPGLGPRLLRRKFYSCYIVSGICKIGTSLRAVAVHIRVGAKDARMHCKMDLARASLGSGSLAIVLFVHNNVCRKSKSWQNRKLIERRLNRYCSDHVEPALRLRVRHGR